VKGFFRPPYVTWSEQQQIESHGPQCLRNIVRIITETGLRIYKELTPMRKDQLDLQNAVVWITDSKTENGISDVPVLRQNSMRTENSAIPCHDGCLIQVIPFTLERQESVPGDPSGIPVYIRMEESGPSAPESADGDPKELVEQV